MYIKKENILGALRGTRTFSCGIGAAVQVYSDVGGKQMALSSLGPCFCVEASSRNTMTFHQLSQPARTTMRSLSNVLGLWTNCALVLSNVPSGEGTNRRCGAYWCITLSVVGRGVVWNSLALSATYENEKRKKVTCTFQADCALYLCDPVGTFLPIYLPILTALPIPQVSAPTRSLLSSIITALVHVTMMDTPGYARTFPWSNGRIVP